MPTISIILIAIVLVLVSMLITLLQKRDFFKDYLPIADNEVIPQKNVSDNVWERHSIEDSIPIDFKLEYPKAYYSELDNTAFLDALNKTFDGKKFMINGYEWYPEKVVNSMNVPPPEVLSGYKIITKWLLDTINASSNFRLEGDDPSPFQMIHDYWNTWSQSMPPKDYYKYNIDIVLYREAKFHAKHINLSVIIDIKTKNVIGVTDISIKGTIIEDRFGLFPVVQSDKTDLENLNLPFDTDPLANYPPLIDDTVVRAELKRRDTQNARAEKIKRLYEKSPP